MAVVELSPITNRRSRRLHRQRRPNPSAARPVLPRSGGASNDGLVAPDSGSGSASIPAPTGEAPCSETEITPQEAVVLELFGRPPVAFHRVFVDIAGSVTAALWLSHAIGLAKLADGDIFAMSQEDCSEATGLSRREQETARARLRAAGLVVEARLGRLVGYRVDFQAIAARLMACCSRRAGATVSRPLPPVSPSATGTAGA